MTGSLCSFHLLIGKHCHLAAVCVHVVLLQVESRVDGNNEQGSFLSILLPTPPSKQAEAVNGTKGAGTSAASPISEVEPNFRATGNLNFNSVRGNAWRAILEQRYQQNCTSEFFSSPQRRFSSQLLFGT